MKPNLSKPESIGRVESAVYERLLDRYQGEHRDAVLYPGIFTKVKKDNDEVLDALGSFKIDAINYAQDTYKRLVKRAVFGVDLTITRPGFQQRTTAWHSEGIPDGISLLSVSALPTEFVTQPDLQLNNVDYLQWMNLDRVGVTIYKQESIQDGVDAGVFEVHTPNPGDIIDLDHRIHRSPINLTGELVNRVFLGCEITFKRR